MRPIQKTIFPIVLFLLTIGNLPNAIIGSCAICIKNRYGLIFFVTTAITSS